MCRAVGTTPSLDGGAEAAAGGSPFSVAESAVVEVGLPASTLLFTQDVVLSVCEVSRHTDVECVRHRLPSIPLLQHRYLVTPPVEGIVCRAVGTTPSLDGGAEAAAGDLLSL